MLKQDTFSLFTYWHKCIIFEIKIIKRLPNRPIPESLPSGSEGSKYGTHSQIFLAKVQNNTIIPTASTVGYIFPIDFDVF